MMRTGARSLLRSAARPATFAHPRTVAGRRWIATEAPHLRSRSWKSSALRWGIAIAGIYYYNTSAVFAEHPENNLLNPNVDALEDTSPTLDALTASSRRKHQKDTSVLQSVVEKTSIDNASSEEDASHQSNAAVAIESPEALEEEAAGEGAFNPVTGEINWDCPCLGGMAYGPCGPQFREAFSCFVYSTEEPKGMDCIDKFQAMQNCFREHPDVYKGEIEDDEELDAELAQEREQLAQEIAERKKAVDGKTQLLSDNRLLEEPKQNEAPKKTKKSQKEKKATTAAVHESDAAPQPERRVTSSSEPQPGMSEEHEALKEGVSSPVARTPTDKPIEAASVVEDELIPKASYDATTTKETAK